MIWVSEPRPGSGAVDLVRWHPTGTYLATADSAGVVCLWDVRAARVAWRLPGLGGPTSTRRSPHGSQWLRSVGSIWGSNPFIFF